MKNINRIKALFLDVGGVLLTNGWDRYAREKAIAQFQLDADEVHERHHLTFDTYEEGKLSLDEYLRRVIFHEKRQFTFGEFKEFMFAQSQPFPEMIEFVKNLKNQFRLKTVVVNNEGRELNDYRITQFKLDDFIDAFVSSSFVHFRKPDEDMFRVAMDISHTRPEEAIYIDDRPMFIEVAQSLGLHGVLHSGYDETRLELKKFGLVLNDTDRPEIVKERVGHE